MTERSYQDAVQILIGRMGARWEGIEAEGRDEMVHTLKEELGYDDRQANDAIDAMAATGAIRYYAANAGVPIPAPMPSSSGGVLASGLPLTGVPAVGAPAADVPAATEARNAGYWQIGEGVIESSERKGQVQPT